MNDEQAQRLSLAADLTGQLFLDEPAPHMLDALTNPDLLRDWPLQDSQSRAATSALINRAESGHADSLEELQRDHLYLFIGAGAPLAQPYESPYFSPDGLILDAAGAAVEAAYDAVGFPPSRRWGNIPPDHIGLELLCVGHIAGLIAAAPSPQEREHLIAFLRSFTAAHPARFSHLVLTGVEQHARSAIYRALPGFTRGVLNAALNPS